MFPLLSVFFVVCRSLLVIRKHTRTINRLCSLPLVVSPKQHTKPEKKDLFCISTFLFPVPVPTPVLFFGWILFTKNTNTGKEEKKPFTTQRGAQQRNTSHRFLRCEEIFMLRAWVLPLRRHPPRSVIHSLTFHFISIPPARRERGFTEVYRYTCYVRSDIGRESRL